MASQDDTNKDYVLGQIHQTVNIKAIILDESKDRKQIIKDVNNELKRLDAVYKSFGI